MSKESISITIDEEVIEKLKVIAEDQKRSLSFIINEILEEKFKKEKK